MRKLFLTLLLIIVVLFTTAPGGIRLTDGFHQTGALNPSSLNPVLWLDATTITGLADGDLVGVWPDVSGNGNDVTQATAGLKPVYKTNVINDKPVVRFDGTDDYLSNAATSFTIGTGDWTGFAVFMKVHQTVSWHVVYSLNLIAEIATYYIQGNALRVYPYITGGYDTLQDISAGTFHIGTLQRDSSVYYHWLDGAQSSNSKSNTQSIPSEFIVGVRDPSRYFWGGDIAEILIFASALADSDREQLDQYLSTKWGITLASILGDFYVLNLHRLVYVN